MMSQISGIVAKVRIDQGSIGAPASSMSCFGRPNRVPRPAATTIAPHSIY
jgi:hypothetical protein